MKMMCSDLTSSRVMSAEILSRSAKAAAHSFPAVLHDGAQDGETPVEEMVRAGHHDHWQVLRFGPGEHVGKQHCRVFLAVNHDRIGGHRRGFLVLHRDAD